MHFVALIQYALSPIECGISEIELLNFNNLAIDSGQFNGLIKVDVFNEKRSTDEERRKQDLSSFAAYFINRKLNFFHDFFPSA